MTTNTSFIEYSERLKEMGVGNYKFMLETKDPDLQGVDVFNITDQRMQVKAMIEVRDNVWFFLRECVRVCLANGDEVPFALNAGSCAMTWCYSNGIDYASSQPRQSGNSVAAVALMTWTMLTRFEVKLDSLDLHLATADNSARRLLALSVSVPDWMRNQISIGKPIRRSTFVMENVAFKTSATFGMYEKSPIKMENLARSLYSNVIHFGDLDYIPHFEDLFGAVCVGTYQLRLKRYSENAPYAWIYTTSPGHPERDTAKYATNFLKKCLPFSEMFYDHNPKRIWEVVVTYSPIQTVCGTFSTQDLGISFERVEDNWKRTQFPFARMVGQLLNIR